jgi:hypothetical protein
VTLAHQIQLFLGLALLGGVIGHLAAKHYARRKYGDRTRDHGDRDHATGGACADEAGDDAHTREGAGAGGAAGVAITSGVATQYALNQSYQQWMLATSGGGYVMPPRPANPSKPMPVPEREAQKSETPLVGWRTWAVDQFGLLRSLNAFADSSWKGYAAKVAQCNVNSDPYSMAIFKMGYSYPPESRPKSHAAPRRDCRCGIYAGLRLEQAQFVDMTSVFVVGEVSLWGRVVVSETGYRAEKAYPKTLTLVAPEPCDRTHRLARRIEKRYGIPVTVEAVDDLLDRITDSQIGGAP